VDIPQLQPLSFGELLDRVFTYFRRNFLLFFGLMAVPQALIVAITTALQALQFKFVAGAQAARTNHPVNPFSNLHLGMLIAGVALVTPAFLVYIFVYTFVMAATTHAISEIHLGRPTSVRSAYRAVRGKVGSIAFVLLLLFLRGLAALVILAAGFFVGIGGIAVAGAALGPIAVGVLGVVGFFAAIAGFVLMFWFFLRYSFAVSVVILENLKGGAAIRRSIVLAEGNTGRIFVMSLLMGLVSATLAGILQGPFFVATAVMAYKNHLTQPPFWLTVCSNFAGGVGHAATGGLAILGIVLLYYDARVRKEGFDLQIMMAGVDGQLPEFEEPAGYLSPGDAPFSPMNLGVMIALSILTLGVYIPIWFIQKRSGINELNSERKVGLFLPILALILTSVIALLNFGVGAQIATVHNVELRWDWIANLVVIAVVEAVMLVQAFLVRSILEDHATGQNLGPLAGSMALMHRSSFSAIGTFFFGIFYLQYKINEMVETWPRTQLALGADPVPAA
jgi:hypothetical protein